MQRIRLSTILAWQRVIVGSVALAGLLGLMSGPARAGPTGDPQSGDAMSS